MSEGDDKLLKGVKSLLRSVLMGAKEGVPAAVLQREYKELVGEYVPFIKLGFSRLEDFILTVPDVVQVRRSGPEFMFHAVADASTAHIQALVSKQRSKKRLTRPARRPVGGGGGARFLPRPRFIATPRPRPQISPGPKIPNWGALPPPHRPPLVQYHAPPPPQFHGPPPIQYRAPPPPQHHGRVSPEMSDKRGLEMTVSVGNATTGTRTVKVANDNRYGLLLSKAMRSVITDRSHEKQSSSRFEVPPRFRKSQSGAPPQSTPPSQPAPPPQPTLPPERAPSPATAPAQRKPKAAAKTPVTFAEIKDGQIFYMTLSNYCRDKNLSLTFDTIQTGQGGYVSSIKLLNEMYGSEDIYRTAKEAEAAAAKIAVVRMELLQDKVNTPTSSYSDDQVKQLKSRVKEIIVKSRNGLYGTIIPPAYMARFKDDPPPDLMDLIKQWPDIAKVARISGRDIVYPVDEDTTKTQIQEPPKKDSLPVVSAKTPPKSPTSPGGKTKKSPSVKDLNDLYEETVQKQTEFKLKGLVIPKENLLTEDEQIVYMAYMYNPGYFCVQLEDSVIDTISELLQTHCESRSAPSFKELQKGQFCAGLYSADDQWSRAEILHVKEAQELVDLLFVDYGNLEAVGPESVRWLSPELAAFPIQTAKCSLYGVEPLEEEVEWSMKATKVFADLVRDEALIAVTNTVYDELVDMELYLKSDPSFSLNQKLVDLGVVRKQVAEGQQDTQDSIDPDAIVLPEDKLWDVHITFISESTNSVMLRLVGDAYSDRLDQYEAQLHKAFSSSSSTEAPIEPGANYIAYDDDMYHRVRALSQEGNQVTCYFLDHGDTDALLREQLRPLSVDLNKSLPYQAIEVSMCGLEDVATNLSARERLCDLALGRTCVSEAVERDVVPSVVLFDTSSAQDLNINEAVLRAVEEAGSDTPQTTSPVPPTSSTSSTPQRVLSPAPSASSLTEKDSSSTNTSPRVPFNSDSRETVVYRSPRLDSELDDVIANSQPMSNETSNVTPYIPPPPESPTSPSSPDQLTRQYTPPPPDTEADDVLTSNLKSLTLAKTDSENIFAESCVTRTRNDETHLLADSINVTSPYTSSWTSSSLSDTSHSTIPSENDSNQVLNPRDTQFDGLNSNSANEIKAAAITNQSIPSVTRDLLQPGQQVWNPVEYAKRPLPPKFQLPGVGEDVDVHVNITHNPSNFICSPYEKMNELKMLMLDMIQHFDPKPPPVKMEDLVLSQLYASHHEDIWYRAKLGQFLNTDLASVFLVDIGEYSLVAVSDIQPLPWTFWKLPQQAFTAKLGSIEPVGGSWSEAAKYKFMELANEKDLIGMVQAVNPTSGVVSLRLIDTSGDIDVCVDEILVAMKYATFVDMPT